MSCMKIPGTLTIITTTAELQISCQNNNLKSVHADYIYLISYRNAKKANPRKWICPIEK
jgi:hypothetical protein